MNNLTLLFSAIIGIFLGGYISRFFLVGSYLNLALWGIVAIAIGIYSKTKKFAILNGAVYGFLLSLCFVLAAYQATAPIITRIPFFLIMGLIGAICGLTLSFAGHFVKNLKH